MNKQMTLQTQWTQVYTQWYTRDRVDIQDTTGTG